MKMQGCFLTKKIGFKFSVKLSQKGDTAASFFGGFLVVIRHNNNKTWETKEKSIRKAFLFKTLVKHSSSSLFILY
jgi:hypothetical protein